MDILLANPRGFCAGVERAIEIVERALELYGAPIYVRHEDAVSYTHLTPPTSDLVEISVGAVPFKKKTKKDKKKTKTQTS